MENTSKNNVANQANPGFNWKNKNLWAAVVVLVVVVLLIIFIKRDKKEEPIENLADAVVEQTASQTEMAKPVSTRAKAKKVATTTSAPKLSYTEAVTKYKDSRIQFDTECRAVPNNVTYKSGAEIMIDNRSAANRPFFINNNFTVAPYDYKIITLSSESLPRQYLVDCGERQNVATILLQK